MVLQSVFVSHYIGWPSRIWHHRHLRMIGFCWPYWWLSGTWDLRRKTMGVKGVSSGLQGWCCWKREPPCRVFQDISKLFLFCQKRLYSEMLKCPLGEIFLQLIRLSVDNHLANSELRYSMQCGLETLLMFIQQGVLLPISLSGWKRATRFRFLVLFPLEISKRREVWLFFVPSMVDLVCSSSLTWTPEIKFADLAWSNGIQSTPHEFGTHFFESVTYQNLAITNRWFSSLVLDFEENSPKIRNSPTPPLPNIETGTLSCNFQSQLMRPLTKNLENVALLIQARWASMVGTWCVCLWQRRLRIIILTWTDICVCVLEI